MLQMAQFAIIRMQKFQVSDVQGIQKHNQRQGISKSNTDIDYEKSHENYDILNDQNLKYESEIKEKIAEQVKRKPRANSVVLSEFLVTASPEYMNSLSAEEQKKYFEKSLEFIEERYGPKNTLYAVVHQDEATPHMHVGIIPITEDGRLSAKDIFNRQELRELQEEFPKHLQENKFEVVRGEKGSEKKHLSSQEYKEKQDLEKEKQLLEKSIFVKKKELIDVSEVLPARKINIKARPEIKTEVKQKLFGDAEIIKKESGNFVLTPKQLKEVTGYVNAALAVKKDYDRLLTTDLVEENKRMRQNAVNAVSENKQLKSEIVKLKSENNELYSEVSGLKERISDLKAEIGLVYKSAREFLKERTDNVRSFRRVFGELVSKVKEKTTGSGSEFERLHKRDLRKERDKGLER